MTHLDLKMNVNENILQINRMVASRRLMMSWIKPISLAYPFTHIPFGMISNFDFLPIEPKCTAVKISKTRNTCLCFSFVTTLYKITKSLLPSEHIIQAIVTSPVQREE